MSSFPPLLHPSGLRLPREGLLPTILCFLPPTFAFGLPAHQHAGNHYSGFHGNPIMEGGTPKMYETVVLAQLWWSHMSCYPTPGLATPWQIPPGLAHSPSEPWGQAA